MTFYSILFAVLFFECVRILARVVLEDTNVPLALPITIVVLIINNVLFTTAVVEEKRLGEPNYDPASKLLDLLAFALVSIALLLLSPTSNLFQVDASRLGSWAEGSRWLGNDSIVAAWIAILLYQTTNLVWNWTTLAYKRYPKWAIAASHSRVLLYLLLWGLAVIGNPGAAESVGPVIAVAEAGYLFVIRPLFIWPRVRETPKAGTPSS